MDEPSPAGASPSAATPSPDQLREARERAHAAIAAQRDLASSLEERMTAAISEITEDVASVIAQQSEDAAAAANAEIADERRSLADERAEWEQLREEIEAKLEASREAIQDQGDSQQAREQELAELESKLAAEKQELTRWAAELADDRGEVESLRREVRKQEEALAANGPAGEADAALTEKVEQLEADLAAANEQLAVAEEVAAAAEELQQKFQLALADVQQHRTRVAELEQELAERPAAGEDESAELARLRAERDELQAAVRELEARPTSGAAADSEEVEDLRRRFELAVEDVRQLKTDNAELEQRLADAESASVTGGDGLDWESQKQRMLASLAGEDPDAATPERIEERATIAGTIRITDEVVSEKDRRIAELEQQLGSDAPIAASVAGPGPDMSDDERLEAERARLAELEKDWEEKLRAAELELSVSRAKIAREQAELQELRDDLEQQRRSLEQSKPAAPTDGGEPAAPQRRWFNKLGLGGDG